ncbi:MAG TPA: DUF177 domain-containing protein [Acidimicrobiales bacterium]|nr:DUF177 domain-containing protein [Acidimicrobiales bacterium]
MTRTPPSPFVVPVGELRRRDGNTTRVQVRGPLPGLAVTGTVVPEDADVAVDLVLEAVPLAVVAHGEVTAPWVGECRRCLQPVTGEARTEVRELFEETPDPEQTYPLVGDQIDLEPLARDAVLLELPLAPLCTEDCRGLCPQCGVNRNEKDCACVSDASDPRWAALDALREP